LYWHYKTKFRQHPKVPNTHEKKETQTSQLEEHNQLHQIHQLALQDLSMEQISFIERPSIEATSDIDEEFQSWDDDSSEISDSVVLNQSLLESKYDQSDLDDSNPGSDT
jgi:hypothetical protein